MYVILVYDVDQRRCAKMLKLCRRYLTWIQNSVFEGEITEVRLKMLLSEASDIIDKQTDSIIVFRSQEARWLSKSIVGKERSSTDHFL